MEDMLSNQNEDIFGQDDAQQQGNGNETADDIFGDNTGHQEPLLGGGGDASNAQDGQGDNADDIFGSPQQDQQNSTDVFGAQAQGDADDIYSAGPAEPAEPERESALVEWQKQKDQEIAAIDAQEEKDVAEMKEKARKQLDDYNKKVDEAQAKRAKHNLDVDKETFAALNSHPENQWESVVTYIDFNRSDLHEKDVSRMKSLLLQLKH